MSRPTGERPAVISPGLAEELQAYLDFRHLFRNLYSYRLDWKRMGQLVHGCANAMAHLKAEWIAFFEATKDRE